MITKNFFSPTISYVLKLLLLCVLATFVVEGLLRLFHKNCKPIVPYRLEQRIPLLPPNAQFWSSFPGHQTSKYVTNDIGVRIFHADLRKQNNEGGILVVGDSQALGWGVNFDETFASLLAEDLLGDFRKARILASPGMDPEHALFAVNLYAHRYPEHQKVTILALNLGNDLDEIYIGRQGIRSKPTGRISFWLAMNSYLYLDLILAKKKIFGFEDVIPPGINPVLYALQEEERMFLAEHTVKLLLETIKRIPSSENVLVFLMPPDFRVKASQIDKYRRYYRSDRDFMKWKIQVPRFSKMMMDIENYIFKRLESEQVKVVNFVEIAKNVDSVNELFDNYSHHLTPKAHHIVAEAIAKKVVK